MPNEPPPLVYVCASAQDRVFVEMVGGRLRARGLEPQEGGELGEPAPIDERQRAIEAAAAVLVVVSPASRRSSVIAADYRHALAVGKPAIPLIVASARDLPRDLESVQGTDFSRSQEMGWQSLIIALEALGIAHYPAPPTPDLDIELVLARIRTGRIPPTWSVSRNTIRGRRQLSRGTIYGWALTLPLTAITLLVIDQKPLLLLASAYTLYLLYAKFSPRPLQLDRRGIAVAIIPEGVVVQTRENVVWAAWCEATVEMRPDDQPIGAGAVLLQARSLAGPHAVPIRLDKLLAGATLAGQALRSYAAYMATYQPERPSARRVSILPSAPEPSSPIFISYSRRDADFVDRLDLVLQHSGYRTWVDRSDLVGGTQWSRELEQALDQCAAVVVVVSPAAMRSPFVCREYQYALLAGKPVLAVLARTTRRIAAELRPCMRGDCREVLILGLLDLGLALEEAGVRPMLVGMQEQSRLAAGAMPTLAAGAMPTLAAGAMPTLARALRGQVPPNGQVYRGRVQAGLVIAPLALLLLATLEVGLYAVSGSLYFMALIAVAQLGFFPPLVLFTLRRLRYPDVIVALPEGYITFFGSGLTQQHPFAMLRSLAIGRSSVWRGLALINTPPSPTNPYTVWISSTFRGRKRIAGRIVADFARYQQERGVGMAAQGGQAQGTDGAGV